MLIDVTHTTLKNTVSSRQLDLHGEEEEERRAEFINESELWELFGVHVCVCVWARWPVAQPKGVPGVNSPPNK